ncbi:MAG: phosphoribosylformylglycinamidine synthase [Mycoplasmoidaceae bacterium]
MKYVCLKRKENFDVESNDYFYNFKYILELKSVIFVNYIVFYEIENASDDELNQLTNSLFINEVRDMKIDFNSWNKSSSIVIKPLPLQFDNRSDSATKIAVLITKNPAIKVTSGFIIELNKDISTEDYKSIKKYLINPIETYEYSFGKNQKDKKENWKNKIIENFNNLNSAFLKKIIKKYNLSLSINDLQEIQSYYQKENKKINEAELQLFNTYWSDHCRHTTFNTIFEKVIFPKKQNNLTMMIKESYDSLVNDFQKYTSNKKLSLMNMSRINAFILNRTNYIQEHIEKSDEINACSVSFNVNEKKYYLNFKNETHNHPTEISPYGGAATCLGGAIRDILANRAYAFSGIRIAGCANVFDNIKNTLENKIPQRVIANESSNGFSSYGNQIGLSTALVKEYYHQGYLAKHMECGAVLGISSHSHLNKKTPMPGDYIVLFGGDTGIDGIGGASGSSKEHNNDSINLSSEVQNGNPIIERKIQRLFRKDSQFSRLIKRCNDFGAGGASVAIGEIADGVEIHLEKFKIKYLNINQYQILFSESQERMAAVIDPGDYEAFKKLCYEENLNAYLVGYVIKEKKLIAKYKNEIIIDIKKDFLDQNGSQRFQTLKIKNQIQYRKKISNNFYDVISKKINLNNFFSKGLIEKFDNNIGKHAVLNSYGGKFLLTKENTPIVRIPNVNDNNNNYSAIVGVGFPIEMESYPFYLGYYAVVESVLKVISRGGKLDKIYLSFQEYFPKAKNNNHWVNMFLTILGAYKAMKELKIAAIGGKDSVSGTFQKIEIPNTFISFAFTVENIKKAIGNTFKEKNSNYYAIEWCYDKLGFFNWEKNLVIIHKLESWIQENLIDACDVVEGNLIDSFINNSLGNMQNFNIKLNKNILNQKCLIIFQSSEEFQVNFVKKIGKTINKGDSIINGKFKINLFHYLKNQLDILKSNNLYLPYVAKGDFPIIKYDNYQAKNFKELNREKCEVLMTIFPGINSEFDLAEKFLKEDAKVSYFIFKDSSLKDIEQSIIDLANAIKKCDIIAIPGGFSAADEPDGSGKYIANILQQKLVMDAIKEHLKENKLIIGICNGFQALVASGLLPGSNAKITLTRNKINRHVASIVNVKTINANSPWLSQKFLNKTQSIPISHGEGRFYLSKSDFEILKENQQIFSVYANSEIPSISQEYETSNLNYASYSIEGIISPDGLILGRMGHPERINNFLYQNLKFLESDNIFKNAVKYIKNNC